MCLLLLVFTGSAVPYTIPKSWTASVSMGCMAAALDERSHRYRQAHELRRAPPSSMTWGKLNDAQAHRDTAEMLLTGLHNGIPSLLLWLWAQTWQQGSMSLRCRHLLRAHGGAAEDASLRMCAPGSMSGPK
jgi:hypothetical protein